MTGQPYVMRILGFGLRAPRSRVPGTNIAGRVKGVGTKVTGFSVGDAVYGTARGAYAEYARAREDKIALKPASLSFEEAAVVPYAGFAALEALRIHGKVEPGEHVLVVGASGAVGSAAVQLAKAFGSHVTGVCSGSNVDFVRELGADEVIDYTRQDFSDADGRYDLILDIGGRTRVSRLRRALAPRGRLVIVGGEGDRWIGGVQRQLWATLLSLFVRQRLGSFVVKEHAQYLRELNRFLDSGRLRALVAGTYPLTETADAVRTLDTAHSRGRIAITI
jgi:NADPH:quinone reductase-like Zn-dependent oxidoreductase